MGTPGAASRQQAELSRKAISVGRRPGLELQPWHVPSTGQSILELPCPSAGHLCSLEMLLPLLLAARRYCGTVGGLGTPQPGQQLPCALLCPGAQGRVSRGAGSAREWPEGHHIQLITLSKTPPSFSALTTCNRIAALWFGLD